jgi:hypothetical protein
VGKYINTARRNIGTHQVLRECIREDANGKPYLSITNFGVAPPAAPTSTNATVQAWLDKITLDGYTYPSQAQVDIYTAAFDYGDANSVTSKIDLLGVLNKNNNLRKIPFIHSAGAAARFIDDGTVLFDSALGVKSDGVSFIKSNWIPSVNGVNYTALSGCMGAKPGTSSEVEESASGSISIDFTVFSAIMPFAQSGAPVPRIWGYLNDATGGGNELGKNAALSTDFVTFKLHSEVLKIFRGGVELHSIAQLAAASGISDAEVYFLGFNLGETGATFFMSNNYLSLVVYASGDINQANLNTFVGMLLQ